MIALVCLLSVSAISAADTINTDDTIATADTQGTFNDLANDLSAGGNISLTRDYIQTDSHGEIIINKDTIINGNGH
ncbi:MAG: hypothetical protein HUK28_07150, partial [Methanobrevibacter sp.]|nr:hypothetical protein [Methanobrevibacter sp.]